VPEIQQGNTTIALTFEMALSGVPVAGLTPTVVISKNGGTFATPAGAVTEVGLGLYKVAPNAADADTPGTLVLYATSVGADATFDDDWVVIEVEEPATPLNPEDGVTTTGLEIVRRALQTIGKLGASEPLSDDLAKDAFDTLNEMVDNWRTQRLLVSNLTRISHVLTAGTTAYTIGPGGDIDVARPYGIKYAAVVDTDNEDLRRHVYVLDADDFAREPYAATDTTRVGRLYYEPDHPLGIIHVPESGSNATLIIHALMGLSGFADYTTEYTLLPGYLKALRYNLALQLAPAYGLEPTRFVYDQAREAIGDIKRINQRHAILANYFGLRGSYSIYTDDYR
jgi:hypothetical protein